MDFSSDTAQWTTWLLEQAAHKDSPFGLAALGVGTFLEYVFPPFPGDSMSLVAGILYSAFGWSLGFIALALIISSVLGTLVAFELGLRLKGRLHGEKLTRALAIFSRYGAPALLSNRFFPGIRPIFFVAAAMAGIPRGKVLLYSTISATLWAALLLGVGIAIGNNLPALLSVLEQYTMWATIVIAAGALAMLIIWLWRRRRRV